MAKELKGGLEEVDADEAEVLAGAAKAEATEKGLTDDILYAAAPGGKNGEPAGTKPGEEDKPKGKAKPKADEEDEGDEEEPEADGPRWDKDRQSRDQEHARERRELQGQIQAATQANRDLTDEIRALREERGSAASAKEDEAVVEALALVDQLSELSESAQIVAAVKAVKQISLRAPKNAADAARVGRIEEALQSLEENVRNMSESAAMRQGRDDLEEMMTELDEEFGPQYHNDAMEMAGQKLLAEGRTTRNPPTLTEKKYALRLAYKELSEKTGTKGGKPKAKPSLASDAGRGGGLEAGGLRRGSLRSVAREMVSEGKLKGD